MAQLSSSLGASNSQFNHSRPNSPNRSRFDLSRITNFTADAGMIIPFDCFEVLPGDDAKLNFSMVLDTMPLINSSMTQYKIVTHFYYQKWRDLWRGSKVLVTKGRSGNINKLFPLVDLNHGFKSDSDFSGADFGLSGNVKVKPYGAHSLASFLGVPSPHNGGKFNQVSGVTSIVDFCSPYFPSNDVSKDVAKTNFNFYSKVNALPFMMYQSICKNNYVNQNLLQDNKALFPDEGDDDWLLPYNASVVNYVGYESNEDVDSDLDNVSYTGVYSSDDKVVRLDQLRYSMFDDDYFTSALPWQQRGDVSKIEFGSEQFIVDSSNVFQGIPPVGILGGDVGIDTGTDAFYAADGFAPNYPHLVNALNKLKIQGNLNAFLTANQFRELIALSVWQERNARCDGSYNSTIYQHWSENPNSDEHKPQYIGGSADYLQFSTIVSSAETQSSPLGSTAGRASAGGNSYIGSYHCPDYGYIMGIMIIKPVSVYQQGVEHYLSCENVFDDIVQPEFESLSPQPILNKEIFVSDDEDIDNDLFGYQERYLYLKCRQNVNRGLFQCDPSRDNLFGTYTQARFFGSLPSLSYQFLCMSPDNMRKDWLAYPMYPTFKIQVSTGVDIVRNLSYTSNPNTFGF